MEEPMTEMMMKPDEGLADRLCNVRYSVFSPHVKTLAGYDATERSPLQHAAAGELAMSAPQARRLHDAWSDTIVGYTAGINDDTLLDDLAAWIERCAKPPFDPAPVAAALVADIERVTRERLGRLSEGEVRAVLSAAVTDNWRRPFTEAAYDAAQSFTDRG